MSNIKEKDNYIKNILDKDFPIINKYISLKNEALESYEGSTSNFYKEFYGTYKKQLVDEYGSLVAGLINYNSKIKSANLSKKRTDKVNYIINELKDDGVSFDDVYKFFNLSNNFKKELINSIYISFISYTKHDLSKDDIIMYTRKVIASIDSNLLDDFDSFIKGENFKTYNNKNPLIKLGKYKNQCISNQKEEYVQNIVTVVNNGDYEDIVTLIHEFMHSTNGNNLKQFYLEEESLLREKYTEFISIYFEKYTVEFLHNNYNIPKEYFDNRFRLKNNKEVANDIIIGYLPFLIMKDHDQVNYETYKDTIDKYNVELVADEKLWYEVVIGSFLKQFDGLYDTIIDIDSKKREHPNLVDLKDDIEELINAFDLTIYEKNQHFIGSLLVYKIKDKVKPKEVLELSYLLNKDYDEIKDNPLFKKFELYFEELDKDNEPVQNINKEVEELASGLYKKRGIL